MPAAHYRPVLLAFEHLFAGEQRARLAASKTPLDQIRTVK